MKTGSSLELFVATAETVQVKELFTRDGGKLATLGTRIPMLVTTTTTVPSNN
jgi:hypothetical protein